MSRTSIRARVESLLYRGGYASGIRLRSQHSHRLAQYYPEKVRSIPQTPLVDYLMPKMKRLAAAHILEIARLPASNWEELDAETIAVYISDTDAIYYASVLSVASDLTFDDHKHSHPHRLEEEAKASQNRRRYTPGRTGRLVDEQKKSGEFNRLTDEAQRTVAQRRALLGALICCIVRRTEEPATVLNPKYAQLAALVGAEFWHDRDYRDTRDLDDDIYEEATENAPRIAELVREIGQWLTETT